MNDTNSSQQIILIIDDTPSPAKILPRILSQAGFKVWWARSGKKALKVIEKRQPDLILLDIMMPEMDGFEVCQRLKSQEQTRDIPIIFMSARDDTADKAKAFEFQDVFITNLFFLLFNLRAIKYFGCLQIKLWPSVALY